MNAKKNLAIRTIDGEIAPEYLCREGGRATTTQDARIIPIWSSAARRRWARRRRETSALFLFGRQPRDGGGRDDNARHARYLCLAASRATEAGATTARDATEAGTTTMRDTRVLSVRSPAARRMA